MWHLFGVSPMLIFVLKHENTQCELHENTQCELQN